MERLASHGYVVVAPDHVGNTAFDSSLERVDAALRRPLDVADAFDHLISGALLEGCADPEAGYAMVGHSFGGWTTLTTSGAQIDLEGLTAHCVDGDAHLCGLADDPDLSDDRVWAAVPLAPSGAYSLGPGIAEVGVPALVIGGLQDQTNSFTEQTVPIFEHLETPANLAGLDGVGHYSFADPCLNPNDGCGDQFLDAEIAQDQISTLTVAFLNEQRGAEPWLPPAWDGMIWR
jgi:predicted dienelactone hydrolase